MRNLKVKPLSAFFWSFVNTGGAQLLGLTFGIILARILNPIDFGHIAIIIFFTSIANVFVDSGYSSALIRDQVTNNQDYNSVFFFSLFISIICAGILFYFAENIAIYYKEPLLKVLVRIFAISPVIHALMTIHSTKITKELNFKLKAKLSLTAMLIASISAVIMAMNDLGIWSLLVLHLLNPLLLMSFLWIKVSWVPSFNISRKSLMKYMDFGLKLTLSNFVNVFYKGVYPLIIGKSYSGAEAGFYARANSLKNLPSMTIDKVIQRVSFPLLSKLQDNQDDLLKYHRQIIKYTALLLTPIMIGMAVLSEQLILTLIGEKWLPSAEYLKLLCFSGVFFSFQSANMNIIKVHAEMNLFLVLELFKFFLLAPILLLGWLTGVKEMLIGLIIHSIIYFIVSAKISSKLIEYQISVYLKDLSPSFLFSFIMYIIVNLIISMINYNYYVELLIGFSVGLFLMIILYETFRLKEYLVLKKYILNKIV